MKNLSSRFVVGLITFIIGISCVSVWLVQRYSQSQIAKPEVSGEPKIPNDTLITLERTGCYGTCPSYTLVISADGSVVFHAARYWVEEDNNIRRGKMAGVILSKITQEQLQELILQFEKANYFSLLDSYKGGKECPGGMATDMPTVFTSFQTNGRRKAISHYHGCEGKDGYPSIYPPELTDIEKRIDEIVNTEQWLK